MPATPSFTHSITADSSLLILAFKLLLKFEIALKLQFIEALPIHTVDIGL